MLLSNMLGSISYQVSMIEQDIDIRFRGSTDTMRSASRIEVRNIGTRGANNRRSSSRFHYKQSICSKKKISYILIYTLSTKMSVQNCKL